MGVPYRYPLAGLAIALAVGAFAWLSGSGSRTASQLESLGTPDPQATVFIEPVFVEWVGTVRRTLAGGRGFELTGDDAPGGVFFAYGIPPESVPAFAGSDAVRIWGRWLGTTCEYGTCAPEVEVDVAEAASLASVSSVPGPPVSPSEPVELMP